MAEFLDGAVDAMFGGVLARAQRGGDLFQGTIVEETEDDCIAVGLAQRGEGDVENRADLFPRFGGVVGIVECALHIGLVFTAGAADFAFEKGERGKAGGLVEPGGQKRVFAETPGLPGENDEDRLGDFAGANWIADVAKSGGVDLVDVARDEHGEGVVGVVVRVLAEQLEVILFLQVLHSDVNAAGSAEGTMKFKLGIADWRLRIGDCGEFSEKGPLTTETRHRGEGRGMQDEGVGGAVSRKVSM